MRSPEKLSAIIIIIIMITILIIIVIVIVIVIKVVLIIIVIVIVIVSKGEQGGTMSSQEYRLADKAKCRRAHMQTCQRLIIN